MKWNWKLGTFAGIDIFVHATFLLIVGWYGYFYWLEGRSLFAALEGIAFVLLVFVAVVLHEYGHALTARKFNIKTRDITLYPIGGVARLERMPEEPAQELWIALAGPAVNLVIAFVLFIPLMLTNSIIPIRTILLTNGSFMERIMIVNITLLLFNLIPAFPMDGGRVLRAILAMKMDYVKATRIAANIGQAMALVFGFWGLFNNPILIIVALFVWMAASEEASMVLMKKTFGGIPVSRAMLSEYHIVSPDDTLSTVSELILAGSQHDFPVVDGQQVVGVITRDDFVTALTRDGQNVLVSSVMHKNLPEIDSHDLVETALNRIQESGLPALPVMNAGRIVGLITSENIKDFLMIRSAVNSGGSQHGSGLAH